ncbi:MAG: hypothetical protein AAF196_16755 [Planctomycetota bacterium]
MRPLLSISFCLAAAAPLLGQSPTLLFTDSGTNDIDKMGYSVRTAGDLNGDKIPDYIYSAPFVDFPGRNNAGLVRVRSGADHSLLYEFEGDNYQDEHGYSVGPAGDVNGDGFDDFLITQLIGSDNFTGSAEVHSGLDGSILLQLFGNNIAYDFYGVSGAGVGDVNADGYDDVAIGAPAADPGGLYRAGEVTVYSGFDGSVIHLLVGPTRDQQLGWFVDAVGDINGDGCSDFIAGAPTADSVNGVDSGAAYVYSGSDGSVLFTVVGDGAGDQCGWCVSGAGDVNKDGVNDFMTGAPLANSNGTDAGTAKVYSGVDGSVLYTVTGDLAGDNMGWCVRNLGDLDGDGYGDFGAGAYLADVAGFTDAGVAKLFSGQTGSLIHAFEGASNNAHMGFTLGTAGDLNLDGFDEVILGADFADVGGGVEAGILYVYELSPPASSPPVVFDRGAGCPGSNNKQPRADLFGRAALGEGYGVSLRGGFPSSSAVLNLGLEATLPIGPFAPECELLVSPLFSATLPTSAAGLASVELFTNLPMNSSLIGVELHHQWVVVDPTNNLLGLSFSDDVATIVGN